MTTLIPKTTPLFCHEWQKASNSSSHLVVTRRASILILIIIIGVTIIVLVLKCLSRRRKRRYKATKVSLSSCNMIDTSFHLTQLITECVKASIHALKLHHDRLKGHTTRKGRRSGCGWSKKCRRSRYLGPWPLRSKLGLASSNSRYVYNTYDEKVWRLRIGDKRITKNPHDSWRKNELITGRRIFIDNYKVDYELRGEIYSESLKKG